MQKCIPEYPIELDARLSKISSEEQEKFLAVLQDYVMGEWIDTFTDRIRDFLDDSELCEENPIHLKEGGYAYAYEIFSRLDFQAKLSIDLDFRGGRN